MTKELAGFKFIVKNGFQSELPQAVKETEAISSPVVESESVVIEQVEVREVVQELDVPTFMKGKKIPAPVSYKDNVVYVDFGKPAPSIRERVLGLAISSINYIKDTLKGGGK